jgi:uncharacterized protein (TIGR03083 family)
MATLRQRRESVSKDLDAFISRLHGLNASQWNLPTPNKGWEVRHLAAHLAGTVGFMSGKLRLIVQPDFANSWKEGDAVTEDSPHEAIISSLTINRNAIVATLAELTEDMLDQETGEEALFFAPTADLYLNLATVEAGLHLYDLFAAVDRGSAGLSTPAIEAGAATFGSAMAAFGNRNEIKPDKPLSFHLHGTTIDRYLTWTGAEWHDNPPGEEPLTTVQADDTVIVLFVCGRIPADDHRLGVQGDKEALATFKTWIPGP